MLTALEWLNSHQSPPDAEHPTCCTRLRGRYDNFAARYRDRFATASKRSSPTTMDDDVPWLRLLLHVRICAVITGALTCTKTTRHISCWPLFVAVAADAYLYKLSLERRIVRTRQRAAGIWGFKEGHCLDTWTQWIPNAARRGFFSRLTIVQCRTDIFDTFVVSTALC